MGNRKRAAVAALVWSGCVAAGLVACGGGGGAGVGAGGTGGAAGSVAAGTGTGTAGSPGSTGTSLGGSAPVAAGDCTLFPAEAVFNTRIDDTTRFPALAQSAAWIAQAGAATPLHADWWRSEDPTQRDAYYGMPVNTVDGSAASTEWASMLYDFASSGVSSASGWPHESDCAVADGSGGHTLQRGCSTVAAGQRLFPIPKANLKNEGGTCNDPASCGDHHLLVVETGACRLWEGYASYRLNNQWYTLSSAAWDLKSTALRPLGWTAADAAGLPITPFLAKASEATAGEIRHALRVTFRDDLVANAFTWPARHAAGSSAGSVPFGALLRLRADFAIPDAWTPQAKAIATAAKRYGMYVADIGSDFYVQGEPSAAWDEATFRQLAAIQLSNMEFVDLGAVTGDPRFSSDSMAARWN